MAEEIIKGNADTEADAEIDAEVDAEADANAQTEAEPRAEIAPQEARPEKPPQKKSMVQSIYQTPSSTIPPLDRERISSENYWVMAFHLARSYQGWDKIRLQRASLSNSFHSLFPKLIRTLRYGIG